MEKSEIFEKLVVIFQDVLDNDSIKLTSDTTANDLEEWDSLSHIQLIVEIEKRFKLKFTASEIRDWKTVGEMVATIEKKAS